MSCICAGIRDSLHRGNDLGVELGSGIKWGFNRFAKLTDKVVTTRNTLSSAIGFTIFFQKMPPYLKELPENFQNFAPVKWLSDRIVPESLHFYKGRLEAFKDPLTILDFFHTGAEVINTEFWAVDEKTNTFKTSTAKIWNKCTKLIYTGLEGLLILPNKWNMINLESWCTTVGTWSTHLAWVTPTNIFIVKELFVVTSAGFGAWNATEEINKATGVVEKNKNRSTKLEEIQNALQSAHARAKETGEVVDTTAIGVLATQYEQGKNKIPVLVKTFKDILKLNHVIDALQAKNVQLMQNSVQNADKIAENNQALEKKQKDLVKLEEKVRRIAYFAAPLIGGNQIENAKRLVLNEILIKELGDNLDKIKHEGLRTYISDNVEEVDDVMEFLENLLDNDTLEKNDFNVLDNIWDKLDDVDDILLSIAPPLGEDEGDEMLAKFEQVLGYKIAKASTRILLNESQETKSRITRWFEISKIAIVTLGLLVVTGITLTYLASFAAAIALASWITGLGVSLTGLTKTIYDTFYWKDPKDVTYPTTNLGINFA